MKTKNLVKPIAIKELEGHAESEVSDHTSSTNKEKLKKMIVFGLMLIAFLASMYLLFSPSKDRVKAEHQGINDAVPEATNATLESDKRKAYEQALSEQKEESKRAALSNLADYWNNQTNEEQTKNQPIIDPLASKTVLSTQLSPNQPGALQSYKSAQNSLGSFYQTNTDQQTTSLKHQVQELKWQLSEKDKEAPTSNIDNQLILMEKSYQLASKYFPSSQASPQPALQAKSETDMPLESSLRIHYDDNEENLATSYLTQGLEFNNNSDPFYLGLGHVESKTQLENKSSTIIKAVVHQDQIVTDQGSVKLRLLAPLKLFNLTIPVGHIITARASINSNRMQLKVSSIAFNSKIIPVDWMVYDLDAQPGINAPIISEVSAAKEMLANMGQHSGFSINMTTSAGQQVVGNISRGLIQGVSSYFSKKLRTPRIHLKNGYQVFLIQKKQ